VAKLLATVREPQWQRLEVVVMLALYAGLRQQEIVWLTREDVDLEDGWLHVRSKSAGHRSGRLPNAPSRLPQSWQITPTGLSPVDRTSLGAQWCRPNLGGETRCLFQAADVDDGGPHTLHRLRGTFATTVLRGGGDLESLRGVLGHSVLSVTAGYLAATSESKRRAVQGVRFTEPERAD
jgi:integrase/recombinase XerC